jgi:hypothetical protein
LLCRLIHMSQAGAVVCQLYEHANVAVVENQNLHSWDMTNLQSTLCDCFNEVLGGSFPSPSLLGVEAQVKLSTA